jgi:formate dehydrogenase
MQNRRILDMHFREAGAEVHAVVETNSLVTLWSHLRFGHWSSVVPHTFLLLLAERDRLAAIPLTEPDASHLIGVVASDRDPLPPVPHALLNVARDLDIAATIEDLVAGLQLGLGHTFVVTSDKEGENSRFERELPDADIVISQPFWPAYLTAERIAKAPKLAITAGIGSDHVDLQAAIKHGITVTEVTYSNSISVSEHVVMMILGLVRNYIPSYKWVIDGGWNIADCVARSYDLEAMEVGTVAAGRIGLAVLRRLKPFDVNLHYTDRHRLAPAFERELNVTYHPTVESLVRVCDVVTINAPLHPETEHLFNDALISKMKRGAYLVNTAPGRICDRDAVVRALRSGQLAGYAGDVWYPQPAPPDHPWRTMLHHGMTPHTSGTSLSAQARYSAGTCEILECWFVGRPIREEYLIVDRGRLAGAGAHSYSVGSTA